MAIIPYDPLTAILYLIVGVMLGKAWEKSRWIEKFIDAKAIKAWFGLSEEDKKETGIAE
ncbi:unnamed protein product [marine sediment metagenome]|uniref:Uncharacterized protein n=1 Tax=marine sediment metagenome TaxID=412755 RepID=X0SXH2_9ZZZZ